MSVQWDLWPYLIPTCSCVINNKNIRSIYLRTWVKSMGNSNYSLWNLFKEHESVLALRLSDQTEPLIKSKNLFCTLNVGPNDEFWCINADSPFTMQFQFYFSIIIVHALLRWYSRRMLAMMKNVCLTYSQFIPINLKCKFKIHIPCVV